MARITKQKKILLQATAKMNNFFDAYELHEKVKEKIGIATIYRFLNTLEKEGQIHSFMCESKKIYSLDQRNHAHFICEKCKTKKHLSIKDISFLRNIKEGKSCHFQLDITGICNKCKSK